MGLFLGAVVSLIILGMVLSAVDVNMTHARRIESQVARDSNRIHRKALKGWSADRIARRYPNIPIEHIHRVQAEMARNVTVDEEIRFLESLWSMNTQE